MRMRTLIAEHAVKSKKSIETSTLLISLYIVQVRPEMSVKYGFIRRPGNTAFMYVSGSGKSSVWDFWANRDHRTDC